MAAAGYSCFFIVFCLSFGSISLHFGKVINELNDQDTSFINQMVEDWK